MDGPYPATIHKLVTYWFPPPSLTEAITNKEIEINNNAARNNRKDDVNDNEVEDDNDNNNSNNNSNNNNNNAEDELTPEQVQTKHRESLLQAIAKLDKHNDVRDNIIRTTHQLDYATSGVLLMAKSRKAAGTACQAFAHRTTKKEYLSIVHHNLDICCAFPVLNEVQEGLFDKWMDGSVEGKHRKQRRDLNNRKGKTFVGYMPAHSVFGKWKGTKQKKRKRKRDDENNNGNHGNGHKILHEAHSHAGGSQSHQEKGDANTNTNAKGGSHTNPKERERERVPPQRQGQIESSLPTHTNSFSQNEQLQAILMKPLDGLEKEEEAKLVDYCWKEIKQNPKYKVIFHDLAKAYNEALRTLQLNDEDNVGGGKADKNSDDDDDDDDNGSGDDAEKLPTFFRLREESEDAFYVQAPLAEDPDSFRVFVNPEALQGCTSDIRSRYGRSTTEDGKELDFKPSLTRCVVLKRGFWNGLPVTKLLLQPRTGRRHQLRLHMAILGHAILGDCTYELGEEKKERTTCNRMCLHAHKLSIPLMSNKTKVFVAPDPFVGVI